MPKNDNRSSLKDYKPERKHFDPNVSQLFVENPKPPSTQKGLPENPTFNSQVMSKILSDTPQQQGNTSPSRKKKVEPPVEPPKEKITPTPGRKKVDNRPQDHKYGEMFAPKSPPLEMRSVKATQVGKIFESNEYPQTQDLQKHQKKERKHFETPIQPDENYFSEAKALAYYRRNNSRKVIIASDETPYSEKKCIDELASKLAKALGRKKPVPPPETPIPSTHHITRVIYTGNKRQVIYEPQTSKRPAQSATSRAAGSSSAAKQLFQDEQNAHKTHPSGSATPQLKDWQRLMDQKRFGSKEENTILDYNRFPSKQDEEAWDKIISSYGGSEGSSRAPSRAESVAAAGSPRAPSVATSAAAGSSRATSRAASVAAAGLPSTPARAVRNAEDSEKLELRNKGLARKIKLQEYLDRVLGNGNVSAAPDRTDPLKERTKIIEEQVKKSKNRNNEIKLELQKLDNTKFMKRASDTGELTPNNRTASRSASLSGAASPGAEIQPAARPGAASSRSTSPGAPETGAPRAASPEAASLSEAASSRSSLSRSASVAAAGSSRSASPGAGMIILRGPRPPGYSSWQGNVTSPTSPGTNMTR